ncbi:transketolase [Rhodococcoides yunnanense]|uniref:transketolase n=1 Tax=Rhodococcoides yunnanense TaxID=278209 RepID=UPI000932E65E|nr:transketolase [Rhodococcus yunnanensis]
MTATYDELPALMTRMTGDEKHDVSATSTLDVLWVLYRDVLRIDPADPENPDRDRFLLSKGHGPMAYYAVLAAQGFLAPDLLDTFGEFDSVLGYHPDRTLIRGVEISSGSLGHGLGLAAGVASALRLRGSHARVFVLLGDAELDEGSNAEAIQFAGRAGLRNLTAVVIDNRSAGLGWPGGIGRRFEIEGWNVENVNGRDHRELRNAFTAHESDEPHAVVARVEDKDRS